MNAVEIHQVSKAFSGARAVDQISLNIGQGEFFSLLGPSGCGKTTLLRLIAGLEAPDSGHIIINGQDVSSVPANRRPVNMVFQNYALFPHLSVYENIAFGLRLAKTPPEELNGRVKQALDLVRLPHLAARNPRELSGGQQQRIAFARAIVNRPAVLLLDEPLSALDAKTRLEMQIELARFKRELSITFVMVSHDQSEAFALSDRIAVLCAGKVEQTGSPQEIYNNPQSVFVADFIGNTNLLKGTVQGKDGRFWSIDIGDGARLLSESASCSLREGSAVTVWLRSSSIELRDCNEQLEQTGNNVLQAEVLHCSFQGDHSIYQIKTSQNQLMKATLPVPHKARRVGEQCLAVVSPESTRVLHER